MRESQITVKKLSGKVNPGTVSKEHYEKVRLESIASMLFNPKDKNPYIFNGKPLKNFQDLKDYLVAFTEREALWVASWIEYLGDEETTSCIRRKPKNFKTIIYDRYNELLPYVR